MIPIWGSGRSAIDHFQNGNYWRGFGYSALAVSDVFLIKSLAVMATRGTITLATKTGTQLWTSTSKLSSAKNAFKHWKDHGKEFPEFINAKQYVEGAKSFMHNSPAGTLIKTRANGDILKYHPGTNTFGVMDASGVPRTMFRPTNGMEYWLRQK